MRTIFLKSVIIFVLTLSAHAHAIVAGSENSVSIQSHTFFPAADADNEMRGFGWFQNGFSLENAATSCTFNSVYPVSGSVNMNQGTLMLNRQLVLQNITTIESFGTLVGNNQTFLLGVGIETFPTTPTILQDVHMGISADIHLTSTLFIRGTCEIHGNGNELLLGDAGFIVVEPGALLELDSVVIRGLAGKNIMCVDDTGRIELEDTSLELTGNFFFSQGSLLFNEEVEFSGSFSFVYDSSQSSTIFAAATFHLSDNALLNIGRFDDFTSIEPIVFEDTTAVLRVDNSVLHINEHGATLTNGTLKITGVATIETDSTIKSRGLAFGNGIQANDLTLAFDSAAILELKRGVLVDNIINPNFLRSTVNDVTLYLRSPMTVFIEQDEIMSGLTLKADFNAALSIATGKTLRYENVSLINSIGQSSVNGYQLDTGEILLNGGQSASVIGGSPYNTVISGSDNSLFGAPTGIFGQTTLRDQNAVLVWGVAGSVIQNVILNGGTLLLQGGMNLANDVLISGSGVVGLNRFNIFTGQNPLIFNDALYFTGDNGSLVMNGDITLNNTWTFSGNCEINGQGSVFDLANGDIVVEQGSRLIIHDVILQGLSGSKIRCIDSAGEITLFNVKCIFDNDFTFTQGTITCIGNVELVGFGHQFAYQSTQTLTVQANSSLLLDTNFTFSYDPETYPDLLKFIDNSSQLILNQATLHATKQGLQLTKGNMQVNAIGTLSSEIVDGVDNGITLGDCFNANNDFRVNLASCIYFNVSTGSLNYKNVNASSWLIVNNLLFGDNTSLNVYKTLTNGTALTNFGIGCFLRTAPGETFNGSISGSPTVELDVLSC